MLQVDGNLRRADIGLVALLCLSVLLNIGLTVQLHRTSTASVAKTTPIVPVGTTVGEIRAKKRDGTIVRFNFKESQRPLAIYVLSPSCMWCERNLDNIRELTRQRGNDYRFVGITVLPIEPAKAESMRLGFEVYEQDPSDPILTRLGIEETPTTVVFSPTGVIHHIWRGAYTKTVATDVQAFFHLRLPGLT